MGPFRHIMIPCGHLRTLPGPSLGKTQGYLSMGMARPDLIGRGMTLFLQQMLYLLKGAFSVGQVLPLGPYPTLLWRS